DIGSAFTGLNNNIKNVNQRIKEVSEGVAQDSLSWSKEDDAFVAKHGENEQKVNSKIKFLQNGDISESSTEAVNGSQLYSLNKMFATYFGGGAGYNDKGEWSAPSFKVVQFASDGTLGEEKSYDTVADAFGGVNSAFTNIHNELKNEISKVEDESLVKQDKDSKVIAIGGETDGTSISITNSGGTARTLSGVKDGALSEASTEAVNGSQLYSLGDKVATYLGGGAKYENGE
ncbi:hypothetical protein ME9_00439, partial [Bartonella taylorii 8TBB]